MLSNNDRWSTFAGCMMRSGHEVSKILAARNTVVLIFRRGFESSWSCSCFWRVKYRNMPVHFRTPPVVQVMLRPPNGHFINFVPRHRQAFYLIPLKHTLFQTNSTAHSINTLLFQFYLISAVMKNLYVIALLSPISIAQSLPVDTPSQPADKGNPGQFESIPDSIVSSQQVFRLCGLTVGVSPE